jgi:hypothetical protein
LERGVGYILNVARELKTKCYYQRDGIFEYKWLDLVDALDTDLFSSSKKHANSAVDQAIAFIDKAKRARRAILVHCAQVTYFELFTPNTFIAQHGIDIFLYRVCHVQHH